MQDSKCSDRGQDIMAVDLTQTRMGHVLLTYVGGKDAVFKLFECMCLLSHRGHGAHHASQGQIVQGLSSYWIICGFDTVIF